MSQTVIKTKSKFNIKRVVATLFGAMMLMVSALLVYNAATEWLVARRSSQELQTVQQELADLQLKQEELTGVKEKLSDPTYVQNYARGTHLMSKSEEQVFVLPRPSGDE